MLSKDKAKSEKDQKDKISTISKFSFASFHQCNWHVEHISPNNAQYKDDNSGSKAFLDDIIPSGVVFDEKEKFKESNKLTEEQKSQFDKFIAITDNSIMSLKNLTLLTEHINTSIGNDFFHDKRTAVLNKQSEGFFVPPSTFMIFTKGYTEKIAPDELNFWHENDRNMYMDKIYDNPQYVPLKICINPA